MSSRPSYSDEFKSDAVNLVISSGRSPASVAPELGISVTALKRWVQLHREGETKANGKPDDPVDPAKYKALEARLREVTRENDFLKKCRRVYRQRTTVETLYRLVQEKNAAFPVTWMCARLGIPITAG